jgi:hypothetical protein
MVKTREEFSTLAVSISIAAVARQYKNLID